MMAFDEDDRFTGTLDWGLWRRILKHAIPYRSQLGGMMAAGLLVAAVDTMVPAVTGWLIDEAMNQGFTATLWGLGAVYLGCFAIIGGAIFAFIVLAGKIATGVGHDIRRAGFARMQELSFSFFDTRPVGWLVSRLMGDISKVAGLLPWFFMDLVWGGSVVVGAAVFMLWLDASLAVWVLAIVPPLAVLSYVFQRRLLESSREVRRSNARITAAYSEAIAGVRTTRALTREAAALDEFQVETGDMFSHSMRRALQSAVYLPLVIFIGSAGVGLALWRGGVAVGDGVSLGTLVAFTQYAGLFYMPIRELAQRFTELQGAQAAAERVQTLLETRPEIEDAPQVREAMQKWNRRPRSSQTAFDGGDADIERIDFEQVDFWYKPGEPVLRQVSFGVKAGQTVALVGPTGGGKTTVVSLLARFYDVKQGAILINGVDHRERSLHWLQSNLGVVLQSPHLFSGTVAENIRYGRLDATDDEVRAAARRVGAHTMIEGFDGGYEAQVGEGGSKLSTGQRQLVSLARAVLADPQIFIMDEATSSLDTETEARVQAGIEAVLQGRIAFVIAHRLSTIRDADLILVVENGQIIEQGRHQALLEAGGRYRTLYARAHADQVVADTLGESSSAAP